MPSPKTARASGDHSPLSGRWVSSLSTGLLVGFNSIAASTAFAALMFSGELSSAMGVGVRVVLLATAAMITIVAWRASYPISIAGVQEAGLAIVATTVSAVVIDMQGATLEGKLATAIAIYAMATLTTGAVFWLIGYFRWGNFVYLLPYPVIAGFLAGSGWLLLGGG
jgi:SulP family sulfate permease